MEFDNSALIDSLARIMVEKCDDVSSVEEARKIIEKSGVISDTFDDPLPCRTDSHHSTDDYNSPESIVYRYLGLIESLMEYMDHNLNTMNDKMKELYFLSHKLTSYSYRLNYRSIRNKGIREFEDCSGTTPDSETIATLRSKKARLSLFDQISSIFTIEYIRYWDNVLAGYKRESARINRIKYLIDNISSFEATKSYLNPVVTVTLSGYKQRLSEYLNK
ncbi:MAG: hypothetical protein LBM63_04575 [Rikenellaceae bacterium]|jgi:hypothetical protein|nr:hypothetical protein [Rikenellaceae bacterium]